MQFNAIESCYFGNSTGHFYLEADLVLKRLSGVIPTKHSLAGLPVNVDNIALCCFWHWALLGQLQYVLMDSQRMKFHSTYSPPLLWTCHATEPKHGTQ